jgi:hypothetical protein
LPAVQRYATIVKFSLLGCSLATLGFLLSTVRDSSARSEWKRHQAKYREFLLAGAATKLEREAAQDFRVEPKQVFLPKLDRVDRCTTCHLGYDDPRLAEADEPLRAHPGTFVVDHPTEQFGCTICHRGQGRATTTADAHGRVKYWSEPMLAHEDIELSCGKCHSETPLAGAPRYSAAQMLFNDKGCISCHILRGRGGTEGPEISDAGIRRSPEWHFEHFKDPQAVVPESNMTNFGLTDHEAELLTSLVMSFDGEPLPPEYLPGPKLTVVSTSSLPLIVQELDPLAAKGYVGSKVCITCHKSLGHDFVLGWETTQMAMTFQRLEDEPYKERCLACHSTGYNLETGHYAEESVTCEACHGPGKEYVKQVQEGHTEEHRKAARIHTGGRDDVCTVCHKAHVPKELHVPLMRQLSPGPYQSAPTGDDFGPSGSGVRTER